MDRCPTCGKRRTRSTAQNRRYWELIGRLTEFVWNGQRWSKLSWHLMFKDMYLMPKVIELPSGKKVLRDPDSHDLDVAEFNDYMTKVEAWAAERGVFLDEIAA